MTSCAFCNLATEYLPLLNFLGNSASSISSSSASYPSTSYTPKFSNSSVVYSFANFLTNSGMDIIQSAITSTAPGLSSKN